MLYIIMFFRMAGLSLTKCHKPLNITQAYKYPFDFKKQPNFL